MHYHVVIILSMQMTSNPNVGNFNRGEFWEFVRAVDSKSSLLLQLFYADTIIGYIKTDWSNLLSVFPR